MRRSISNAADESKPQTEDNKGFNDGFGKVKVVGGWTKLDNRLFWQGTHLTPNAKVVYATLRSFTNSGTQKTFPSYDAIMGRSGLSRPKVAEGLRELEHFSWITKSKGFSKSTNYTVSYPTSWLDKSRGILLPDQIVPTKAEAKSWAKKIREERKAKRAKRERNRGWNEARRAIENKQIEAMELENEIPF